MEAALKLIGKSFTRYFMPGLVFTFFSILIPAYLFFSAYFNNISSIVTSGNILVLSLVIGYLLDSAGLYKWTLHLKKYNTEKHSLVKSLKEISHFESSNSGDPDSHIHVLWQENEMLYDRIMAERAEWVLVLETAFALLFSSVVVTLLSIYWLLTDSFNGLILLLPVFGVPLSYLISSKGIQRMQAHNLKLLYAVKYHYKNYKPSPIVTTTD